MRICNDLLQAWHRSEIGKRLFSGPKVRGPAGPGRAAPSEHSEGKGLKKASDLHPLKVSATLSAARASKAHFGVYGSWEMYVQLALSNSDLRGTWWQIFISACEAPPVARSLLPLPSHYRSCKTPALNAFGAWEAPPQACKVMQH